MSRLSFNHRHPVRNAKQRLAEIDRRNGTAHRLRLAPFAIGLLLTGGLAQAAQNTTTTYEYDPNGNLTGIVSPLNTATNPVRTDFPWIDSLNRLTEIDLPGPDAVAASPVILLQQDGQDRLTVLQDPRLLATFDDHDGLGNRNTLTSPDSGLSYETHDEAGNLTSRVDARGIQTTYSYDALNRLKQVSYGSGGTPTVFEYDDVNLNPGGDVGRLRSIVDESGGNVFLHDEMGRLFETLQRPTLAHHHDYWVKWMFFSYGTTGTAKGKLTSFQYPSGNQINYSYDAAGRISAITLNLLSSNGLDTNTAVTTNLLTAIKYTPTGQFLSGTFGNNTSTVPSTLSRTYDLDGGVQSYPLGNAKQGGTVRTLAYDAGNRITQMSHTGSGTGAFAPTAFNQTLGYDNLDRITGYTLGATSSNYSYDDSGNRLTTVNNATPYNHSVDPGSNRVQNTTGPAPAKNNLYDNAGNLLSDGTNTYTYSDRGLMQSTSQGLTVTQYAYNGLGQRVMKRGASDSSIVQYYYDPQGHLVGEYDVYGNPIQETVYLGDIPVAVLTQTIATTTTGSVMTDNSDTANVSAIGSWPAATTPTGFQGTNYQTHAIAAAGSTDSFTWKLNLPASFAGKFWVQARWPADASRASDATYRSGKLSDPGAKSVDQRGNSNTWVTVGMTGKGSGYALTLPVILTPSATGTVAADAVRTLPVVITTNVNYIFADHLNTPRVITRASDNKIVWRWDQADPYGVKQPNNNPNALGAFTYNLRFPGQLYDPETGLYYNGHRYYEPDTGTYTQSDPIGLAGGVNTYAYVLNNPIRYTDPKGLFAGADDAAAVAVCIANPVACAATGVSLAYMLNPSCRDAVQHGVQACANAMHNEASDDAVPNEKELTKVKERDGNKVAQEAGYEDAHDAKDGRGEGGVDIYRDKTTGDYWLWNGVRGGGKERL